MRALGLAAILLAGCPRSPAPPPTRHSAAIPTCAPTAPGSTELCPKSFTPEHLACVRCPGVSGCLDAVDQVYCVAGGCTDPRCERTP